MIIPKQLKTLSTILLFGLPFCLATISQVSAVDLSFLGSDHEDAQNVNKTKSVKETAPVKETVPVEKTSPFKDWYSDPLNPTDGRSRFGNSFMPFVRDWNSAPSNLPDKRFELGYSSMPSARDWHSDSLNPTDGRFMLGYRFMPSVKKFIVRKPKALLPEENDAVGNTKHSLELVSYEPVDKSTRQFQPISRLPKKDRTRFGIIVRYSPLF